MLKVWVLVAFFATVVVILGVVGFRRYFLTYKNNIAPRYTERVFKVTAGIMTGLFTILAIIDCRIWIWLNEWVAENDNLFGLLFFWTIIIIVVCSCFYCACMGTMKFFSWAAYGWLVEKREQVNLQRLSEKAYISAKIRRDLRDLDEIFIANGLYKPEPRSSK